MLGLNSSMMFAIVEPDPTHPSNNSQFSSHPSFNNSQSTIREESFHHIPPSAHKAIVSMAPPNRSGSGNSMAYNDNIEPGSENWETYDDKLSEPRA
ncbi:hypothetical protein CEK25_008955 [Fusarium fujikuroi]|nr:hypothetical protein CEK25_008955 [Fusarium fujikuroi]